MACHCSCQEQKEKSGYHKSSKKSTNWFILHIVPSMVEDQAWLSFLFSKITKKLIRGNEKSLSTVFIWKAYFGTQIGLQIATIPFLRRGTVKMLLLLWYSIVLPPFTFFKCAPNNHHFENEMGMKKTIWGPAKHRIITRLIMCFNLTGFSPAPQIFNSV